MKKLNKNELKKIEKLLSDFNFEYDMIEDENNNQLFYLKKSDLEELKEFINDNKEEYKNIDLENFQKKNQIHISRDKDIKIDMIKISGYNLKLIYHRKKDNNKEYRIFISYKDKEKKMIRKRYLNEDIRKIHNDENKMIEFLYQIEENQIKEYINK